jgi:hypothetical protein
VETGKWNSRYVAYAKTNGNEPEQQLEKDRSQYPGGCMTGFMEYIQKELREFVKVMDAPWILEIGMSEKEHEAFTEFLFRRVTNDLKI